MQVDYFFHTDNNWQVALTYYWGSTDYHSPKDPPLRFF